MPAYKDKKTGKWYCQFYYVNWRGERKHKVKRGFERKKDAETWERSFLCTTQVGEDLTMDRIIDEFISHLDNEVKLGNIKFSTRRTTLSHIRNHIVPYFTGVLVNNITVKQINDWLAYEVTNTKLRKRLSSGTLGLIKDTLGRIFSCAHLNHGINNPVQSASLVKPYSNDKRVKFWTIEQYNIFRKQLWHYELKVFFDILFFAGLRIGEALILTPADIGQYYLNISKSLTTDPSHSPADTTKNESSIRRVEIPTFLYDEIMDVISKKYDIQLHDRIFHYSRNSIQYQMRANIERCGLPRTSPHGLRHSYASLMYQLTKDITLVAHNLGHKNIDITLKVYSHMLPSEIRKGQDDLNKLQPGKGEIIDISSL